MSIQKFGLSFLAGLIALLSAELGLRYYLQSPWSEHSALRSAELYANPLNEDVYWQLWQGWNPKPSFTPDPDLGWVGAFQPKTYLHEHRHRHKNRRPVILIGDSFSACVPEEPCFETLLEADPTFSQSHYLLNYGVGGYGLDQSALLLEKILPRYPEAIIIVGIMTLDIDRTQLHIREAAKPTFEVVDGQLQLMTAAENHANIQKHPPDIFYLYRRILYSTWMPTSLRESLTDEARLRAEKQNRSRHILEHLNQLLMKHEHHFLIFHPHAPPHAPITSDNWRDRFLQRWLDAHQKSTIWSKDLIFDPVQPTDISQFIRPEDGHPTTLYNSRIAQAITTKITVPHK